MHLLWRHLHERDDARAALIVHLDHALEQWVAAIDQVVAQQHRERIVTDMLAGTPDRMAEPEWLPLAQKVHLGEIARLVHLVKPLAIALLLECLLELGHVIEMARQVLFVAPGDDEHVVQPGSDGFFDHVLNRRLVDDRQHLFRHRLCRGQESSAEPCGRNHCFRHRTALLRCHAR